MEWAGPERLADAAKASREFYAGRVPGRGPRSAAELAAIRAAAPTPASVTPPPVVEVVEADGHRVGVRIQVPRDRPAAGVLLELHGGGFYLGSAAASDVRNRRLVDDLGVAVVSVDHRLAPEHPWPAAPEDCEAAAQWLTEVATTRFGTDRIALIGFSAGSTLAMTPLLRLRERARLPIAGAVLQFGTYDLSGTTEAGRLIDDEWFLDAYAADAPDRTDPDLSPVFAAVTDLAALPPVLMVVGADDILLHDNVAMAERLRDAGVRVDLRVYPEAPHGFTAHPTPLAGAAQDEIDAWLTERLQ